MVSAFMPGAAPAQSASPRRQRIGGQIRRWAVLCCVVALHLGAFALIQGELRARVFRPAEEPATTVTIVRPPQPPAAEPPPAPAAPKAPPRAAAVETAPATPIPVRLAPADVPATAPALALPAAPSSTAPASPAAPPAQVPARSTISLPSTDADYGHGCQANYPPMSRALHEHGRVTLRIVVGSDGRSEHVDVIRSSGSQRLDEAAEDAMRHCRFKPGTVNGAAQRMAYDAPVDFVLR